MKKNKIFAMMIAVALMVPFFATSQVMAGSGTRLECPPVEGPGDISMSARHESKDDREKFTVSFEAAPGNTNFDGQTDLSVRVSTVVGLEVEYGIMELVETFDDLGNRTDTVGDINFDSDPDAADEIPFPGAHTSIGAGDKVRLYKEGVLVLGCTL